MIQSSYMKLPTTSAVVCHTGALLFLLPEPLSSTSVITSLVFHFSLLNLLNITRTVKEMYPLYLHLFPKSDAVELYSLFPSLSVFTEKDIGLEGKHIILSQR